MAHVRRRQARTHLGKGALVKRRFQTLALLLVGAACLLFLWRHFFPNEEHRVRQCLADLAQAASVPDQPTAAAALLAGDRLRNRLTSDVVLDVEVPEIGRQTLADRPEIVRLALAAWEQFKGLNVQLVDVRVTLGPDRLTAAADLTVRASLPRDKNFFVQELKFQLRQEDRQWRVSRIETVRVLKL